MALQVTPSPYLRIELVYDTGQTRRVVGWSAHPALVAACANTLVGESLCRAETFEGLDDSMAAEARREAEIRQAIIRELMPEAPCAQMDLDDFDGMVE